jgi:hypothetical protein
MSAIRAAFPECRIFASSGNPDIASIPDVERLIYHSNDAGAGFPLDRIRHYYYNILKPFIALMDDINDDERVLLLHQNSLIDSTCALLFDDVEENVFVSGPIRRAHFPPYVEDKSDRCVAFLKKNFVKLHSYNPSDSVLNGKTTIDYFEYELNKEGLKYKYNNAVNIKELDSFWTP